MIRALPALALPLLLLLPAAARAAPPDRSGSPYFVVEGDAGGTLPLESTRADVKIAGVMADVTVTQSYRNRGQVPINARYVFPASTRAAVHRMRMKIGARVIEAKIKEREAARAEYERAKSDGKTASLLEQDRPNVFSMAVANVLPGDQIDIELAYTELLLPTDGIYELVYPTVVAPRYPGASQGGGRDAFLLAPYALGPTTRFGLAVELAAGMPIQSIESPSHAIETQWLAGRQRATIALASHEADGGDRDFVLRYRLAGADIASGLVTQQIGDEKFFLMMVQPPARPAPELIPPREYVFILDVSGSMHGFPLETAKIAMRGLLGRMRPIDRFNVLLFSGDSRLYRERSVAATPASIADAIAFIDREEGGGGTEMLAALERAFALPREGGAAARSFVVVTDGEIAAEAAALDLVRRRLGDASVWAFGIGAAVNRHLIDGLARAGQSQPFVLLDPAEAATAAERFARMIESPVLTQVQVRYDGFDAYDVAPAALPDLYATRPVAIFGKWRGEARGSITLTGVTGRGRFVNTFDVAGATPAVGHGLAHLWARETIAALSDFVYGDGNRAAVVELGLRYGLLTAYTSFIAVHQVVRSDGAALDVDQPLPLPSGMDAAALGMESGDEPPLAVLLLAVGLAALALAIVRRRSAA